MNMYLKVWKQLREMELKAEQLTQGTPVDGMTLVQLHILDALYCDGAQHASALARAVAREATSFTPLLDRLERQDLIERKADAGDLRAVYIHLTSEGEALRETVQQVLVQFNEHFANGTVRQPVKSR